MSTTEVMTNDELVAAAAKECGPACPPGRAFNVAIHEWDTTGECSTGRPLFTRVVNLTDDQAIRLTARIAEITAEVQAEPAGA